MRGNNKAIHSPGPAMLAAMGILAVAVALNIVVRVAHTTPHVGDIVAFQASAKAPDADGTRLLVHRRDQFGCVLDLSVLRRSGGSFLIETEVDSRVGSFSAHWAGTRTSTDPGNCGNDADLILDRVDLDVLELSASRRWSSEAHGAPVFTSDINVAN